MDIREIKEIAKKYTPEQIEECITQQVETGKNICIENESTEKILSELSEAAFIRDLMGKGHEPCRCLEGTGKAHETYTTGV